SGATAAAGGTVTYTVFTTSACSTQAPAAQQPVPATVTVTGGAGPDSAAVSFPGAGTFFWQAAYSGDTDNNAATSACASAPPTVGVAGASIATALSSGAIAVGGSVHDTATLSGATAGAGGTVTYAVYTNNSCSALAAGLQPVPAMVTVTGGAVPDSAAVSFPGAGTFFWQAVYSGDANNGAATSACASEQLTVGKASPSIATSLSPGS